MSTELSFFVAAPASDIADSAAVTGRFREVHAYGPDGRGGFHTELQIAAEPSAAGLRAIAIVGGTLRAFSGGLVLAPEAGAATDLSGAFGGAGALLFVYREVLCWVSDGEAPMEVTAGSEIGVALGEGMGFEIVFAPRGLDLANDDNDHAVWERVKELIAPEAATRRLDPAAFYATLASGTSTAILSPAARSHALRSVLSERLLIEIRDEYDLPFVGEVSLQIGGGATRRLSPAAGDRGTIDLTDDLAGTGGTISLSISDHLLSALPSDSEARSSIVRRVGATAHLAFQALFANANPSAADEDKSWFAANTAPLSRFTAGNRVTPLRDGLAVFGAYTEALRTISAPGHFAHVAGWYLDDQFELVTGDPQSTFHALALAATHAGGEVRGLLWDATGTTNTAPVERINALPNGRGHAILDGDTLPVGSHHQKFLVVSGARGKVAFAGGVDVNSDRLDSSNHGAEGPFHDVHARLEGPSVNEIDRVFSERWNSLEPQQPITPVSAPDPIGSAMVQIACTFPPMKRYRFAPEGALGPLNAFVRAIQKAQKFIYLEDQYLTPYPGPAGAFDPEEDTVGLVSALREALPRIDYLVMVGPNHTDQPEGRERRARFINALLEVAPDKVFVYYLARDGRMPAAGERAVLKKGSISGAMGFPNEIYCHTKSWIVDDVIAKIGSANCNRRSYTHDSEMVVVILDGAVEDGARRFARNYRLELWGELLNLSDPTALSDYRHALSFWLAPPPGARVRRYEHLCDLEPTGIDKAASFIDDASRHLLLPPEVLRAHLASQLPPPPPPPTTTTPTTTVHPSLLTEALSAGGDAIAAVERLTGHLLDHLRRDPGLARDIVDPDGRTEII